MPVTIDSSNIIIDRGASNVYVDIVKTKGYIKKNNVAICIPELEEEYSYNDGIYNYNIFTYNKDIYPSLNIDNSNLIVHWKFDNHNLFHNYSMNPASINVNLRNISNIYSNGVIDLNNKYIGVGSLFKSDQNDIYGYNITPANWMSELLKKEATFTFWIKQTYSSSTNIVQTIFSHDNTFVVKQENGNFRVYMATGNNSYYDNVASFLFTYNTWVHIAIVINLNANTDINNVINIYRNGELLNSTLNTYVNTYSGIIGTGFPNNNNIFRFLSGSETNLNSGFKGNLDDFRIYNKCLNGSEIYNLYNDYKSTKYNIKFENDTYCDMLIVAGGGGGSRRMGGGGGAGALIFDNFTFRKNKEYIFKIGKGGLGVDTPGNIGGEITTSMKTGENGGDSEIINDDICIYRAAGGGGGQGGGTLAGQNAASGGSGGGSGGKDYLHGGLLSNNNIVNGNSISVYRNYYDSGDAPKYNSSKVFGNEGGIGNGDNPNGGGGGGGAGSRGFDSFAQNPNNNNIIKGGDGIHSVDNIDFKSFFSIKNTNIGHHYSDKVYFSGGGGGGNWDGSIYYNDGGLGGGGRSGMSSTLRLPNINGMLNTGGGGGGEGKDEYGGGHGGSGVLILKYKLNKIDSSQEYDAQWKYKRNTSNVYFMGNVGIGTKSNPEYSLNVQGDINITGDLYKNGALIEYPKYLVKTDDIEISPILDLSLYKDSIDENFTSTPSILYKYHILTFEGTSGYTSTTDGNQRTYNINFPEDAVADILIVGGGGAGGKFGGGGGAGAILFKTGANLNGNVNVKVGRGGVGSSSQNINGENGKNSSITISGTEYISVGGGGGGVLKYQNGLKYKYYNQGYFNENVNWFSSYNPVATGYVTDGTNIVTLSGGNITAPDTTPKHEYYSFEWIGFFKASVTGTYTFYTESDDASYCWVGPTAISGFTTGNALVKNGGLHGVIERSGTINLIENTYYPIRYQFGENQYGDDMRISFAPPGSSRTYNGNGYFYSFLNDEQIQSSNGISGGSGGGGAKLGGVSNKYTYAGWESYGNTGGNGNNITTENSFQYSGGGGGAGSLGYNSTLTSGGNGGAGKEFISYFGTNVGHNGWFAGGGGGQTYLGNNNPGYANGGYGLFGGGGIGGFDGTTDISAGEGLAGTGGGGGGGKLDGGTAEDLDGGDGGSGIVIIRYYTIPKLINNDILTPYGDIYKYSIISKYKYLVLTHSGGTEDQTIYQVNFPQNTSCDILVVGGGGAGGRFGGGGGAGAILFNSGSFLNGIVNVKVGRGGIGSSSFVNGENGKDSSITINGSEYISIGGGGGGGRIESSPFQGRSGNNGGSGGGGSHSDNITTANAGGISTKNTYTGWQSYGNSGGEGKDGTTGNPGYLSGGGGGAGGIGGNITSIGGGYGGAGKEFISYFGTNVGHNGWFAGGGGGNTSFNAGIPGYPNGGNGLFGGGGIGGFDGTPDISGGDGLPGTGGGGGGSKYNDGTTEDLDGGDGGSGIVIIRHLSKYISGVEVLSQWNYNYIGNVYNLGNVGIGTTNPKTELDVIGDITGNTKNFKINHPLISNKWLYHGTIEAPRYENLYRGRKIIKNGKGFINIDKECNSTGGMSVGTFLALNSNCDLYLQNNTTYDRVIGYIENGIIKVQCENINDEIEIDWLVISERKDGSLINTPSTNYQGKMICEHKIEDTLN